MTERPRPVRDDLTRAYWDGAQQEKLVLQRCRRCDTYVHPPRAACPACFHDELEPTEVSGRGSVYSWSIMHSAGNPGFAMRILVVEDDPPDPAASIPQSLLGALVGAIDLGVVRQLAGPPETRVESLSGLVGPVGTLVTVGLEQVTSAVCQRHDAIIRAERRGAWAGG